MGITMTQSPILYTKSARSVSYGALSRPCAGTPILGDPGARGLFGGELLNVSVDSDRAFRRFKGCERWRRVVPPIGFDRAREWMCDVRGDCWCRSEQLIRHRNRLGILALTTRFFARDAVHEFPRIRSAGLFPMKLFRISGCPQLLLMQPTLCSRREVGDTHTQGVFMIRNTRRRGCPKSGLSFRSRCFSIGREIFLFIQISQSRSLPRRRRGSFEMTGKANRTTSAFLRGDPCSGSQREVSDRDDWRTSG